MDICEPELNYTDNINYILRRSWEDNIRIDLRQIGLEDCGMYSSGSE
jgi:hypothetical protein